MYCGFTSDTSSVLRFTGSLLLLLRWPSNRKVNGPGVATKLKAQAEPR